MKRIPPLIRFTAWIFLVNFFVFALFRLCFLLYFIPSDVALFSKDILSSLVLGLKFDARLAALIILPLFLLSAIPGLRLLRSKRARVFWLIYLVLSLLAAITAYCVDFGAYSYIHTRLNATLLMYLDTPEIAMNMVLESYPWLWLSLGTIIACGVYFILLNRLAARLSGKEVRLSRWKKSGFYTCTFLIIALLIYGKFQRYPLRWSDAFIYKDNFICQFALNPILFFFDTLDEKPRNFDTDRARKYYPAVAEHLGVIPVLDSLSLRREGVVHKQVPKQWNVVLIFLETFASFKVGVVGNPLDSSPCFDELARQGLLFTRYYVPMENTSRSLFAALFGIPDVSTVNSSSRNPLVVNQHTILNAFKEYRKFYFLGGSANWGNIRGMLAHNVDNLTIYEEGSYSSPVVDVWGICDADLFEEADAVFTKTQDPFFAIIQTSGNHRPFTIPDDAKGFKTKQMDSDVLKQNGFYSLDEFNGFRFLDHSLGHFFKIAANHEYFDHTLFIIQGDHGTNGGSTDRRYGDMNLSSVHVPLLFYAPGLVKPETDDRVISELDLMASIAGYLGKPYINTTLGRDIFQPGLESTTAFVYTPFRNPPRYGTVAGNFFLIRDPDGSSSLYQLDDDKETDVQAQYPDVASRLLRLSEGYFEMARYLLYNNAGQ